MATRNAAAHSARAGVCVGPKVTFITKGTTRVMGFKQTQRFLFCKSVTWADRGNNCTSKMVRSKHPSATRTSGTSPATMRWARPSVMDVLPTPGSPMRHGLFLVRRASTRTWRREAPPSLTHHSTKYNTALKFIKLDRLESWRTTAGMLLRQRWRASTSLQ